MNDWYILANHLETAVPPLDALTQKRIEKRVRAVLPRQKKRPRLAAAIAAALLLTACGYAAATGQFSHWFRNLAEDPKAPEASENLLASMGTVIGQSQTVNSVTATLHGALWDGKTLMLSVSLENEDLPEIPWATVDAGGSWLHNSRESVRAAMEAHRSQPTEAEVDEMMERYWAKVQNWFQPKNISYFHDAQTGTHSLLIEGQLPYRGDTQELTLHLENLSLNYREDGEHREITLPGPFAFTFTVEKKNVKLVYFGEQPLVSLEGTPVLIRKISLTPFQAMVHYTGMEKLARDSSGNILWANASFEIEGLRINGQEIEIPYGDDSHPVLTSAGPDGSWEGSIGLGPLSRVFDPASVEAILINGAWLELSDFTLMEADKDTAA